MRIKAIVNFILDEEDLQDAETELESQLSDMLSSNLGSSVRRFEIEDCYELETISEDDGYEDYS